MLFKFMKIAIIKHIILINVKVILNIGVKY
jgi:hypothetical protein